jgi:hypothetical protein
MHVTKSATRKIKGSLIGFIGFLLSPLTWWNDLFVNVPLALAGAWLVALIFPSLFEISFIAGYWLTNILGLVLLHKGGQMILGDESGAYTKRHFIRDILISLAYTLVIVLLVQLKVLQPVAQYFR